MRQQRIELVQPDAVPPALAQRPLRLIAPEHGLEVRAPEQRQHGEVCLAMAAVRRRVYQHRAVRRPHDVSAPQIAVQTGWRIVVVEIARITARDHGVDGVASKRIQARRRTVGHGCQPLVGVETAPRIAA